MPAATVNTLNAALTKVLAMPDVKEFYRKGGYEAGGVNPGRVRKTHPHHVRPLGHPGPADRPYEAVMRDARSTELTS